MTLRTPGRSIRSSTTRNRSGHGRVVFSSIAENGTDGLTLRDDTPRMVGVDRVRPDCRFNRRLLRNFENAVSREVNTVSTGVNALDAIAAGGPYLAPIERPDDGNERACRRP